MIKKKEQIFDRETAKWSVICTTICMLIAHAYRYLTLGYSNDSAAIIQTAETTWKISIGRYLQYFYWMLRGDIVAPYLIGVLATLWLSAAVYGMVRLMRVERRSSIALMTMLLCSNITMTQNNATYIHEADVYMLAVLVAVLAVASWDEIRLMGGVPGMVISAGLICASCALYQSYFQVTILLMLMVLCRRILDGEPIGEIIAAGIRAIIALVAGLVLYEISLRVVGAVTGIERATTANGVGTVGGYLEILPQLLKNTYCYPFSAYLNIRAHNPLMTSGLYIALLVLTVVALALLARARKISAAHCALLAAMILLMPLGMNAIYFISKGHMTLLMIFSFFVIFVFTVYLLERLWMERGMKRLRMAAALIIGLLFFNNTVYANQMYLRRDLEFQSTLSVMTRVIDRAEQVEGYEPGFTPVAIVGTMYNSPLSMMRWGFEHLSPDETENANNYFVTASETFYPSYFWSILGYPFNFVGEFERSQIANEPDVRDMPVFPAEGCCVMRDGILVIKVGGLAQNP